MASHSSVADRRAEHAVADRRAEHAVADRQSGTLVEADGCHTLRSTIVERVVSVPGGDVCPSPRWGRRGGIPAVGASGWMYGGELWSKSVGELAALIRAREVSSVEVVQAHLDRISEVNESVNAITVVLEDALVKAKAADASPPAGAFHGVPMTVKENLDVVGSATTCGIFPDAMPSVDDPMVERLKAAGGIVLGRTNMAEMGLRITTDNPLRGRTYSPWDRALCTPGSSGGDGVAWLPV